MENGLPRTPLVLATMAALALWSVAVGCQDYAFEYREKAQTSAQKVTEVIRTDKVDILFVIDNSDSMVDETAALRTNVEAFVSALANTDVDFQLGIVTTDVECNLPDIEARCSSNLGSQACCFRFNNPDSARSFDVCQTQFDAADPTKPISSTCDGGRLRSPSGIAPVFGINAADRKDSARVSGLIQSIVGNVRQTLAELGCKGSGMEAGLEAARTAVNCATGQGCSAADAEVARLNAGFIRDDADLVVIFMSDEDDCSFADRGVYYRPQNPGSADDQARHLCSPDECYAPHGFDADGNTIIDWAENLSGGGPFAIRPFMGCVPNTARLVNPPAPDAVDSVIDTLVARKGGNIARLRAAAIVSAVPDPSEEFSYRASRCYDLEALGPSDTCGCWANDEKDLFCDLTSSTSNPGFPDLTYAQCGSGATTLGKGCGAMPSRRYAEFLKRLSSRRKAAGLRSDTLMDSICRSDYEETLFNIVNTVILTSCFDLPKVPDDGKLIDVRRNGESLKRVDPNASETGWSFEEGSTKICLEGGLTKNIGDRYEIYLIDAP